MFHYKKIKFNTTTNNTTVWRFNYNYRVISLLFWFTWSLKSNNIKTSPHEAVTWTMVSSVSPHMPQNLQRPFSWSRTLPHRIIVPPTFVKKRRGKKRREKKSSCAQLCIASLSGCDAMLPKTEPCVSWGLACLGACWERLSAHFLTSKLRDTKQGCHVLIILTHTKTHSGKKHSTTTKKRNSEKRTRLPVC